jgi:acetyltransferase EpsM
MMQSHFPFIIYGAGGHGRVIAETLELLNQKNIVFWDKNFASTSSEYPVFSPYSTNQGAVILGIGNLQLRKEILDNKGSEIPFISSFLTHPTAFISPTAKVGRGTWIGPLAIVHAHSQIGEHCIINSGAIVDHDTRLGRNVHVAPGAVLCGQVSIGDHTFIGANAVIPPGISIGNRVFIKAGSVVKENVADGGVV